MSGKNVSGGGIGALNVIALDDLFPVYMLSTTFSAVGSTPALKTPVGIGAAQVVAPTSGAPTSAAVVAQGSNDGTTWTNLPAVSGLARFTQVRLTCTALSGGTTPAIYMAALLSA